MTIGRALPATLVVLAAVTGCASDPTATEVPTSSPIEGDWVVEAVVGRTLVLTGATVATTFRRAPA